MDKDIHTLSRIFEEQIKATPLSPEGTPASTLSVPCRPPDLDTDDLGLAFEGSFEGQQIAPDWVLVHGFLSARNYDEAYAWLENVALQVAYDVELDRCYRIEDYYKRRHVVALARFNADDAAAMARRHGHLGPWMPDDPVGLDGSAAVRH